MRRRGQIASVGEKNNAKTVLVGHLKDRDCLRLLGVDVRKILKLIIKK
jgi:hypothetical protein